jgi:hypothetical protein
VSTPPTEPRRATTTAGLALAVILSSVMVAAVVLMCAWALGVI